MGFAGKLSADSDVSAAMHALAQHNDNASHIAFIDRLRESSSETYSGWRCGPAYPTTPYRYDVG
jgi:hypothetical protein